MNHLNEELEYLKTTLLQLKATGSDGFEGLMGFAISKITGIPMRLAASGTQFGVDGASMCKSDAITFEAKRYENNIPRESVITKIADLARRKDYPDVLWILGATHSIKNQLVDDLQKDGENNGISVLIFDWSDTDLPSLAVILASIVDEITEWISEHLKLSKIDSKKLKKTLSKIKKDKGFTKQWSAIKQHLEVSSLATENAIKANKKWLKETFSDRSSAKLYFDQPLSPYDNTQSFLPRTALLQKAQQAVSNDPLIILGEEGCGKSWLMAQLCAEHDGLSIIISAENFEKFSPNEFEECILRQLSLQAGEQATDYEIKRWKNRFDAWEKHPPKKEFWVAIDGINQRASVPWDKYITRLTTLLDKKGGKLIISSRPEFFERTVANTAKLKNIMQVNSWSENERDTILNNCGIEKKWLDETALNSLLNPRLLDIAISVLPASDDNAWRGLTVHRLLFEHIRKTQIDSIEDESPDALSEKLSKHASQLLDQIKNGNITSFPFENEARFVAETRFFETVKGPKRKYKLKNDGLELALGFAIVDRLWEAYDNIESFNTEAEKMLDPILSLDATASVILAALTVCAFDNERFETVIFECLMKNFLHLQNLDEKQHPAFLEIVSERPESAMNIAKYFALSWQKPINNDWLVNVSLNLSLEDKTSETAIKSICEWFLCVNINAEDQQRSYGRLNEKDKEKAAKKQLEINKNIEDFSTFEAEVFRHCEPVSGDVDALYRLGLQLLSGKPLAPIVPHFLHLGMGLSLNSCAYNARSDFIELMRFNRVDPLETIKAIHTSAKPLFSDDTSTIGKWMLVRMLFATGLQEDAEKATDLAKKLRDDWPIFENKTFIERYCSVDPCNPNSSHPDNVSNTTDQYAELSLGNIRINRSQTSDDRFRQDALPALSRFSKDIAIGKNREIIEAILKRNGSHLRQIVLCDTFLIPLVTKDVANRIIKRAKSDNILSEINDREHQVLLGYMLYFVFHQLSGNQQLEVITNAPFKGQFLPLDLTLSMRAPDEKEVLVLLQNTSDEPDYDIVFAALTLIANTYQTISKELEKAIVDYIDSSESSVRATIFEIAIHCNSDLIMRCHNDSAWQAADVDSLKTYESWYGSALLIKAAKKKLITFEELLQRISVSCWYLAYDELGSSFGDVLLLALDKQVIHCSKASEKLSAPAIDITLQSHALRPYHLVSIESNQQDSPNNSFFQTETDEDFYNRQDMAIQALKRLEDDIITSNTKLLLDRIDYGVLSELLSKFPEILLRWVGIFDQADQKHFFWLKNIALIVASVLSKDAPERAIKLFEKAIAAEGHIRYCYGDDLSLEQRSVWKSAKSVEMQQFWKKRFTSACSDLDLAIEVLAAEKYGASNFIEKYVKELTDSTFIIDKALAITIAGFSKQYNIMKPLITTNLGKKNYLGEVAKSAMEAHERAVWSNHWTNKMWSANNNEDFWLNMNLLTKICDARVEVNPIESAMQNDWDHLISIFATERKKRIEKWKKKREKTLYGLKKPNHIFVTPFTL